MFGISKIIQHSSSIKGNNCQVGNGYAIINGEKYEFPKNANVYIVGNKLYVNGKLLNSKTDSSKEVVFSEVKIVGNINNVECDNNLTVQGDISGDVNVNGNTVITGDIDGDINCNGNIAINGNHSGNISAQGNVTTI